MEIWQYLILVLSVLLGGGVSWWLVDEDERWQGILPLLLSFSGAYLLGIVALELIPETFSGHFHGLGLFLLLGFVIQLLLESLSEGVEHGHVHARKNAAASYGIQVMLGLSLHAFLEGLPLAGTETIVHAHGTHSGMENLFSGIVMHKVPAAFALALLLRQSGYSKLFGFICLAGFALMSPLGAWVGSSLMLSEVWYHRVMALVIGSLLHVSTTILFEADSTTHHRISGKKLLIIIVAMSIAWLTAHG
ncbi:zinc/iron permease [Lewinellaceae bacterium SD302]|nr:zinc/iron permease [Lewinellaceae bacterium SD302]